MSTFRVLSLDGGGIKGVFAATVLAELEEQIGEPLWRYFDLVAGTSTGGILAIAVALGTPAKEIKQLYLERASIIFPVPPKPLRWLYGVQHIIRPRYDPRPLRNELSRVFGERTLGEARTRLVIPSLSALTGDVYIYKTRHHERLSMDHRESVVDVAMATAAAPTYFPAYRTNGHTWHLDGGTWANNPVMLGVVEAMSLLRVPAADIRVLSIGATLETRWVDERTRAGGGLWSWKTAAVEWLLHGQSIAALNQARLLIGKENLLRLDSPAPCGIFKLDGAERCEELAGRGREVVRNHLPRIRLEFLSHSAEAFVPAPSEGSTPIRKKRE